MTPIAARWSAVNTTWSEPTPTTPSWGAVCAMMWTAMPPQSWEADTILPGASRRWSWVARATASPRTPPSSEAARTTPTLACAAFWPGDGGTGLRARRTKPLSAAAIPMSCEDRPRSSSAGSEMPSNPASISPASAEVWETTSPAIMPRSRAEMATRQTECLPRSRVAI